MRRARCRALTGRIKRADCYRGLSIHASLPKTVVGLRFFFGIRVELENEGCYHQIVPPSSLVLFFKGWSGSIPYCAHRPSKF